MSQLNEEIESSEATLDFEYNKDWRVWDSYPDKPTRDDEPWKGEETT